MKVVLAAIGGFMAAAVLLGCGALLAVHFLINPPAGSPGPAPGSAMESDVLDNGQALERIAPRPLTESQLAMVRSAVPNGPGGRSGDGVDMMTTAATGREGEATEANEGVADSATADPAEATALAAHLEWCAQRYRSYRPRDNSYTPYGGGRAVCVSPYSEGAGEGELSAPPARGDGYAEGEVELLQASAGSADDGGYRAFGDAHVAYCFSRYRSYDPADNSYQPFGGGPRRQCLSD